MTLPQLILLLMKVSVICSVFVIGLETRVTDVTYLFRHPKQLGRSLLPMYLVMPLAAILIVYVFELSPAVKIALVALSVSPIPPLLPKKQLKAGGGKSYTISLLVAISLLAIILVPLWIELLSRTFQVPAQIDPRVVAKVVLEVILSPLALGLLVNSKLPTVAGKVAKPLSLIASVFLGLATVFILVKVMPDLSSLIDLHTIIAILAFNLIGLVAGHTFGGPRPDDRIVLALSTVSRHPGIAVAIASINFPSQKLALAAILLNLLINAVITLIYLKQQAKIT